MHADPIRILLRARDRSIKAVALIDADDEELCRPYVWYQMTNGYVAAMSKNADGERCVVLLHRLVMDAPAGKVVDHRFGDVLDCRKRNLRVTTQVVNGHNRHRLNANNKSGVRGVFWTKRHQKWQARIQINGRVIGLGLFHSLDAAAEARRQAEVRYCEPA